MIKVLLALLLITQLAMLGLWAHWLYIYEEPEAVEVGELMRVV